MRCKVCGHENEDSNKFCESCGNKLIQDEHLDISKHSKICMQCGTTLNYDEKFCQVCGAKYGFYQSKEYKSQKSQIYDVYRNKKKKKLSTKIIIIAIASLIVIGCCIAAFVLEKNDEDIEQQTNETSMNYDETDEYEYYDDYIITDSDKKIIDEYILEGLSDRELMLARNEIFAREGRLFKDSDVRSYFESKGWYEGYIEGEEFDANRDYYLNSTEKKNIDLIKREETNRGIKY